MSSSEITDAMVLAAVDRAERHQPAGKPRTVPAWAVYEHLGLTRRSGASRRVHAQLVTLDGSALSRGRRHGVETWGLTANGRRRLSRLRTRGGLPELPESPQHRKWREARELAAQRIGAFSAALFVLLERGRLLLDERPPSDAVFELGERLQKACRRLGSASYCLDGWAEPDDAQADIDECSDPSDVGYDARERAGRRARRAGRRNALLWGGEAHLIALGEAICQEREQHGVSAAELARKAGIDEGLLASVETGHTDPPYDLLLDVADALGVGAAVLVGRIEALEAGAQR